MTPKYWSSSTRSARRFLAPASYSACPGACSEKFIKDWVRRGVNFMCMNFDFNYIVNGAKNVMQTSHTILDDLKRAY